MHSSVINIIIISQTLFDAFQNRNLNSIYLGSAFIDDTLNYTVYYPGTLAHNQFVLVVPLIYITTNEQPYLK